MQADLEREIAELRKENRLLREERAILKRPQCSARAKNPSRRVIGWAASNRLKKDLAISALEMAVALRKPPKGCIRHSPFRGLQANPRRAVDNAAMEAFFKTIKAELIWRHSWETRRDAEVAIFEYISGFYNPRRRRSALGWKSPFSWFVSQTMRRQRLAFERFAA